MTQFRMAFVVLAAVWALMLPAAPFAASRPASESSSAGSALALIAYGIGRLICHQRPERSFFLFGTPLPVCARCTGIYAGAAVTAVVAWFSNPSARWQIHPGDAGPAARNVTPSAFERRGNPPPGRHHADATRRVLLMAVVPTVATLLYEWTTGQTPGSWTRAASGVPLGVAVAWIVCVVAPRQSQQVAGTLR